MYLIIPLLVSRISFCLFAPSRDVILDAGKIQTERMQDIFSFLKSEQVSVIFVAE
jgi:hypothetical protein